MIFLLCLILNQVSFCVVKFLIKVDPEWLKESLDRFAQFFIGPLFDPNAIGKEMNAVDSEFSIAVQEDSHRAREVIFGTSKKGHVFTKFGWGNAKSLGTDVIAAGIDLRSELVRWYENHYSANLMKLVVLGRDLDELEKMVRDSFGNIANRNLVVPDFSSHGMPFDSESLGHIFSVQAVKKTHVIEIMWAVPYLTPHYQTKPAEYIGHILGHEGSGSLLSRLREKSLATELCAGAFEGGHFNNTSCSLFLVSITLTELGLKEKEQIIELVFGYIACIKSWGIRENVWNELKMIAEIEFRYLEKLENIDYVEELSTRMHFYPLEHFLCGDLLFFNYMPELIQEYLNLLTFENCRISFLSDSIKDATLIEPWFGTLFKKEKITLPNIPIVSFHLPQNIFVPENFSLIEKPTLPKVATPWDYPPPQKICENELGILWYKDDHFYNLPRVNCFFHFRSSVVSLTPASSACSSLFVHLLLDALTENLYPSTLVEYSYSIRALVSGIEIKFSGFSDKIDVVGFEIFKKFCHAEFSPATFVMLKEKLSKKLDNIHMNASSYASFARSFFLHKNRHSLASIRSAHADISLADLYQFRNDLLSSLFVNSFIHGNCTGEHAKQIYDSFFKNLVNSRTYLPSMHSKDESLLLPVSSLWFCLPAVNKNDSNSVVDAFFQMQPETVESRAINGMLAHMMYDSAFDQLRTKEQLGYAVFVNNRVSIEVFGLSIVVISSAYHPCNVFSRIDAFIAQFYDFLEKMSVSEYQDRVSSYINFLLEAEPNMAEESSRLYEEIIDETFVFDRRSRASHIVQDLAKEKLLSFYEINLLNQRSRRNLNTLIVSANRPLDESQPNHFPVVLNSLSISGDSFSVDGLQLNASGVCLMQGKNFVGDWVKCKNSLEVLK